ncbi:MAG: hypothetical protein RL071_996 [Pseudomonadota bacterium]
MPRSAALLPLHRALHLATFADQRRISTGEAHERLAEAAPRRPAGRLSRRALLGGLLAGAGVGLLPRPAGAAPRAGLSPRIAVVGAGLGGLATAYELQRKGLGATVFEAGPGLGGRCQSLRGLFPGQVAELGAELIDTTHTNIRSYARELGLRLESYAAEPGERRFFVEGRLVDEAEVTEDFRALVPALRADLRASSGAPTAAAFTAVDEALDHTPLDAYLADRGASRTLQAVFAAAYEPEYGRPLSEQSALNLLLFIHPDRRSELHEFGVFSDERYHIIGGNDQVRDGLAAALGRAPRFGHRLTAAWRTAAGAIRLRFETGGPAVEEEFDEVVLALPFPLLRGVDLRASLGLPAGKRAAIDGLRFGTNSKVMVGFDGRPWQALGSDGGVYGAPADGLSNVWETNGPSSDGRTSILTDFSGGARGAAVDDAAPRAGAEAWLRALEGPLPGVPARATRTAGGGLRVAARNWARAPLAQGSYPSQHPGYFTTIAGWEGTSVDNLHFAGDQADSFYSWQGYMEGAVTSGIDAADAIWRRVR